MELFRQWLLGIAACAILAGAAEELSKGSAVFEVVRFCGGLLLLLCMLRPLCGWQEELPDMSFRMLREETAQLQQEYELLHNESLKKSIEERTGAYIEAQAQQMGISVRAVVEAGERDGFFVPASVSLSVQKYEPLAQWIDRSLGIPAERQSWREDG